MNAVVVPLDKNPARIDLLLRKALLDKLTRLENAVLTIRDPLGEVELGFEGPDGLRARIDVLDMHFYRQIALGGSIGAAESYMDQDWQADVSCLTAWKAVWQHWLISCSKSGISLIATRNKAAKKISPRITIWVMSCLPCFWTNTACIPQPLFTSLN